MTQPNRYILHPFKFTVSLITAALCLVLSVCEFLISRPFSAAVFIGTALLFSLTALYNGSRITVCNDGIHWSVPGIKRRFIPWDGMKEVGVFGSRLFSANKNRAGTLYIYFSTQAMTEEERFQMVLHWPPKDKIILQYSKERMDTIQLLWSREIQTYNAGDFHF
ncbi:MAG: hypothetical protein K2O16_05170 [Lachnospiraceae bacterium]|nr:hypothetical protein [Lachnospiraceae bacterium]MDE7331620.1 hypothetical protein [Lachnospiraceae bacterium]